MDEPPTIPEPPVMDALEVEVRALCSRERAWLEPHVADVVLPDEDPVGFVLIRVRLEEELRPEGDIEREAILTITAARWRRRRIERICRVLMIEAAGPGGSGAVHDRERRARLAACRMERSAELRIEHAAAAELRRSRKAALAELKGRAIPETKAMRAQAWEHELQLDAARREVREAEARASAAEARLAGLAGTASAASTSTEAPEGDPAMHPTEESMRPWLVRMGERAAPPAAPMLPAVLGRPQPGPAAAAMADRLARKLGGEAADDEEGAWAGAG